MRGPDAAWWQEDFSNVEWSEWVLSNGQGITGICENNELKIGGTQVGVIWEPARLANDLDLSPAYPTSGSNPNPFLWSAEASIRLEGGSGSGYGAYLEVKKDDANYIWWGYEFEPGEGFAPVKIFYEMKNKGSFSCKAVEDAISPGEFHTFRIDYDGSTANCYIDGVLKVSNQVDLKGTHAALLARSRGSGDYVDARFDDFRIYSEQPAFVIPAGSLHSNLLGRVFFIFNNEKYYITNPAAFTSYGLDWKDVKNWTGN